MGWAPPIHWHVHVMGPIQGMPYGMGSAHPTENAPEGGPHPKGCHSKVAFWMGSAPYTMHVRGGGAPSKESHWMGSAHPLGMSDACVPSKGILMDGLRPSLSEGWAMSQGIPLDGLHPRKSQWPIH